MNDKLVIQVQSSRSFLFYIGLFLLLVAAGSSFLLASTKLGLLTSTPGCGEGSGCDTVTNGPWGTIPWIGWPVSFLGLAWFIALFMGWLKYETTSRPLLWAVRLGVLGSIGFIVIMVSINSYCQWCLLAHACNILFWIMTEFLFRRDADSRLDGGGSVKPILFIAVVFIGISALFWGLNARMLAKNRDEIIKGPADESTLRLLEARHRFGVPDASIQIVMFTDYQCPDCKRIEGQLSQIMKTRNDISISVKHFPMNFDCNENIGNFKLHGNACWAARAAEAASIIGGEEGWLKMHKWLFEQGGQFTNLTLPQSLAQLGFDHTEFTALMKGDEVLQRVKDDTDDASDLGIYFTPMIFINGVEYLWYYGGEQALANVIATVAESIKQGGATLVEPPNAADKLVEDWRRGKKHTPPGHEKLSWIGDGPIEFVVWSDYQAGLTRDIDSEIKKILERDPRIRYAFRHFPVDDACNAGISNMKKKYDGSCFLAKLVESVDVLAGSQVRWSMHDWLLKRSTPISSARALEMAVQLTGIDQAIIQDVVNGIEISSRMRMDILSKNSVWRRSIPLLVIDGRYVPRWRSDDVTATDLFTRIIDVVGSEMKQGESPNE